MARTWNKCSLFVRYVKDRGIIWEEKKRNAEDDGSVKSSIPKSVKEVWKSCDIVKNGIAMCGPYMAKLADVLKAGMDKWGMEKA